MRKFTVTLTIISLLTACGGEPQIIVQPTDVVVNVPPPQVQVIVEAPEQSGTDTSTTPCSDACGTGTHCDERMQVCVADTPTTHDPSDERCPDWDYQLVGPLAGSSTITVAGESATLLRFGVTACNPIRIERVVIQFEKGRGEFPDLWENLILSTNTINGVSVVGSALGPDQNGLVVIGLLSLGIEVSQFVEFSLTGESLPRAFGSVTVRVYAMHARRAVDDRIARLSTGGWTQNTITVEAQPPVEPECSGATCCDLTTTTWNGEVCIPTANCTDATCCVGDAVWNAKQLHCVSGITECIGAACCGHAGSQWDAGLGRCVNGYVRQDRDNDGVEDALDNCPNVGNNNQADSDGDEIGDACDVNAENTDIVITAENLCRPYDAAAVFSWSEQPIVTATIGQTPPGVRVMEIAIVACRDVEEWGISFYIYAVNPTATSTSTPLRLPDDSLRFYDFTLEEGNVVRYSGHMHNRISYNSSFYLHLESYSSPMRRMLSRGTVVRYTLRTNVNQSFPPAAPQMTSFSVMGAGVRGIGGGTINFLTDSEYLLLRP